jgi:hypothetical protein
MESGRKQVARQQGAKNPNNEEAGLRDVVPNVLPEAGNKDTKCGNWAVGPIRSYTFDTLTLSVISNAEAASASFNPETTEGTGRKITLLETAGESTFG